MRATPSHVEQVTTATPPVVIALVRERASAARLVAAFRPTTVRLVHTVPELSATLHEEGIDVVAVLAEGRDAANNPSGPVLTTLIARFPGIPFLGYCGMGVTHAEELRELAKAGVHELVFRDLKEFIPMVEKKLKKRGIPGFFVDLEPHVKGGGQFGGFSGPDGMGVAVRSLCRVLDHVDIDYHLRDFDDVRAERGF